MDNNMSLIHHNLNTTELTGHVVLPGSPEYEEARRNYNGRFNKFPAAIVYCQSERDVVNAIRWVRRQRLPFRIRSGRHSYEAFSLVDGGLIIDVSGLSRLQILGSAGTPGAFEPSVTTIPVVIGPGVSVMSLYEALWNQGLTIPSGTCGSVGISGITLGGGYGLLSRLWGLSCDNLLELEMVTAQGNLIRANGKQHSDLFWACRGGGDGSYGVITSLTYQAHPIGTVSRYRLAWNFDDLKKVLQFWQQWAPFVDPRLTSLLLFPSQGQGDLRSNGVFVGPEQELRQIVAPFLEATAPKTAEFHTISWIEAARLFAGQAIRQEQFKHSSAVVYTPLQDTAIDIAIRNLKQPAGSANLMALDAYGGVLGQISPAATAFPHRRALFTIQYQSYWHQDQEAAANIRWIEAFRRSMLPYTRGAYRNYCDVLIQDWPTAYFGDHLARLRQIKLRYDPENFFRFEQSIPR